MQILCIHYYYPPLLSTAVIRNYKFSLSFAKQFQQVHVITSDNHLNAPSEKKELPNNISVYDIPTNDYRTLMAKRKKKDSHISMKKKSGRLFQLIHKLQRSYPFNYLLGEGGLTYRSLAYKKACDIIEQNRVTHIYSSFAPYADHDIAHKLKKKYPHIKWIADFRDLQIEPIYNTVLFKKYQAYREQNVLSLADKVVTISESYAGHLRAYGRPTEAILRGVEVREEVQHYDTFTISYTGSLYFDYRDPSRLLQVIKSLIEQGKIKKEKIQILYAGRDGAQFSTYIDKYNLQDIYHDRGLVSQEEAQDIQSRSHVNLLLTSSSPELKGVLTGKVFEYFEAGRPILCLINGVKDPEFESLFEKVNAGIVAYNPPHESCRLENYLFTLYNEMQRNRSLMHTINKELLTKEYSWDAQTTKMLS